MNDVEKDALILKVRSELTIARMAMNFYRYQMIEDRLMKASDLDFASLLKDEEIRSVWLALKEQRPELREEKEIEGPR